jgi:rod shape-determining protein MreD
MLSFLGAVLLAFLALGLQATLVPHVQIAGVGPDLAVVAIVLLAYRRGATTGVLAGFLIGLAQDVTNPAFLGLNALAGSVTGFAAGSLREQMDATSPVLAAAMLFVAVMIHDLVYLTIFTHLALSGLLLGLLTRSLPTALYTSLVGVWVLTALASLTRRGVHPLGRTSYARR